jgi:anti-sigma factor RsiW
MRGAKWPHCWRNRKKRASYEIWGAESRPAKEGEVEWQLVGKLLMSRKMEYETQLKLQAYLDGELPESEARVVSAQIAQDPEAKALLGELQWSREALKGFETELKLPEAREFYWSKLERQLRTDAPAAQPASSLAIWSWMRRLLAPATAVAFLLLLLTVSPRSESGIETASSDSGAFTYRNSAAGTTLVWLSYPAENENGDIGELDGLE